MLTLVVDRVELGHQLRQAIDNGEFKLRYQPLVALDTGGVAGLEALIRWEHPTRGLLSPEDFMEVAEETGAIVPIGKWVLDTACQQARRWKDMFPDVPFRVSVNLSPVQVFQANIIDAVSGALARSGLDAGDLVLELTEVVMVKDVDLAATRLRELKALGVYLAIDDFGTGYSSLNYLRQLPFDILKIDKGFVDGVTSGGTESALTRAIISLAHTLELYTVAEGVEHADQAEALRKLGCRFAQGYLYAKPLTAPQVEALLTAGGILTGDECVDALAPART
jgi:EAL domain-containing protein (putative c-di-GMP-specific phosphodiesterase class I)